MAEAGKKKGSWHNQDHRLKDAINEVLQGEPNESQWTVEIEVKKVSNPVHDYRIVLVPTP